MDGLTELERAALMTPYNREAAERNFPVTNWRQRASVRRNAGTSKRGKQSRKRKVKPS